MIGRLSRLRLLPISIVVMALLLALKSAAIVRAAVPAAAPTTPPAAPAHGATPPAADTKPAAPSPSAPPATASPAAAGPAKAEALVSDAERALLLDLRTRRKELDAREATLSVREGILAATEKRISARADELLALQKKLEGLEKARRERDEANWAELVKVYEGMKPKDAAAIFNDLDLAVTLPVFDRMKPAKLAVVLAAMQPERARLVTTQLAQMRNKANAAPGAAATTAKNGT
jgi:flagellar motility protein MotE (MotC chaperone)